MGTIGTLNDLFNLDIAVVVMGIFIILSGIIFVFEIIKKICEIFDIPVKWIKKKNRDHELILENAKRIESLAKQHESDEEKFQKQNEDIENKLSKLTDMVLKKEINDSRWTILDFSSALSNGRTYNREAFNHIFTTYKDYEKVLEENHMENGLVEESMKFVSSKYQELLNKGELK